VIASELRAEHSRVSELTSAKWENVDLARGEWVIPHSKGKADQSFTVPLVPVVVGWFRELQSYSFKSAYVLPARESRRIALVGDDVHFSQLTLNAILNKLCRRLPGVRRFTPHDLRSTARSHLSSLGVGVIVSERCLNHSLGGLLAIYDQHDYLTERREALER